MQETTRSRFDCETGSRLPHEQRGTRGEGQEERRQPPSSREQALIPILLSSLSLTRSRRSTCANEGASSLERVLQLTPGIARKRHLHPNCDERDRDAGSERERERGRATCALASCVPCLWQQLPHLFADDQVIVLQLLLQQPQPPLLSLLLWSLLLLPPTDRSRIRSAGTTWLPNGCGVASRQSISRCTTSRHQPVTLNAGRSSQTRREALHSLPARARIARRVLSLQRRCRC